MRGNEYQAAYLNQEYRAIKRCLNDSDNINPDTKLRLLITKRVLGIKLAEKILKEKHPYCCSIL